MYDRNSKYNDGTISLYYKGGSISQVNDMHSDTSVAGNEKQIVKLETLNCSIRPLTQWFKSTGEPAGVSCVSRFALRVHTLARYWSQGSLSRR